MTLAEVAAALAGLPRGPRLTVCRDECGWVAKICDRNGWVWERTGETLERAVLRVIAAAAVEDPTR